MFTKRYNSVLVKYLICYLELFDAGRQMTHQIKDLEGANVAVQQSLQNRSRDLSTLMETVKKLRSESSAGGRHHKAKDTPDLTEVIVKILRSYNNDRSTSI
jgi:hypothetical protein